MLSLISSRPTSWGPLPPIISSSYWAISIEPHKDDLSLPQNTWPFTFSLSSKIPILYRIDFSHSCLASVLLVCMGYFLHLSRLESCRPYNRWRPVCYKAKVSRPIKTHLRHKPGVEVTVKQQVMLYCCPSRVEAKHSLWRVLLKRNKRSSHWCSVLDIQACDDHKSTKTTGRNARRTGATIRLGLW